MRLTSRIRIALAVAAIAVVALSLVWWTRPARPARSTAPTIAWLPLPRKVTAEVVNAGGIPGAARAGAQLLRHAGLDVVYWGADTSRGALAHTLILVRRGDTTGVGRVIAALGHAQILDSADATRLVDLTVKLGRDYSPPPDRVSAIH